jgi:hypothetical protein
MAIFHSYVKLPEGKWWFTMINIDERLLIVVINMINNGDSWWLRMIFMSTVAMVNHHSIQSMYIYPLAIKHGLPETETSIEILDELSWPHCDVIGMMTKHRIN